MTREEAIKLIEHVSIVFMPTDQYGDYDDPQPYEDAFDMAIEALSSDAERPKGMWNKFDTGIYLCSNCNWAVGNEYNYCPCCGAKMERREP